MVLSVSSFFAKRMELHLSLAISSSSSSASSCSSRFDPNYNINYTHEHSNKRKHDDYDDDNDQTMPLLVWGDFCCNKRHLIIEEHQDHDGDDEVQSNYVFVHRRNEYDGCVIGWPPVKSCTENLCHLKVGNEDGVIGWPPVKLCRKKHCQLKMRTEYGGGGGRSKSTYYKVHMEGVEIARKVDLNLHQSYQTLVPTLANMFGKCFEDVKLTYQDQEGDWLLAGDVPWGTFINTVQRLKLRRK
ncbi:putative transcription factor interactor and regulator AUX-IAA family [Helianthus debilis subsp. tardiflorus]